MTALPSVITIGIDPTIELGRGLDPERAYTIGLIVLVGALVGGRAFYLLEHSRLDDPGAWLGTVGFTFYGGFIAAAVGIAYYLRRALLSVSYLDAIAAGLPLGLAVGRIGDVINGEHYGPASTFFSPSAIPTPTRSPPNPDLAYHSGGLYEVLIGAIVFAIAWPLRRRLRRPLALMWLVMALLAAGRFAEFFLRSDSADLAFGLEIAQWTSLALLAVAAAGSWLTLRGRPPRPGPPTASAIAGGRGRRA